MKPVREVAGICTVAFFVLFNYELSRSSIESVFLEEHGSQGLPWVWAVLAPTSLAVVAVYSRFVPRMTVSRLFRGVALTSAIVLIAMLVLRGFRVPYTASALYLWKDIHVVVLVELIWTFANTIFAVRSATWLYGVFCACGSLGGIVGGLLIGEVAERVSTETSLWLPVGTLGALAFLASLLQGSSRPTQSSRVRPNFRQGLTVVRGSSYLVLLVLLIATVQIVITLIDWQYNGELQQNFDVDERTRVGGQVYAAINFGSLVLQLGSGIVLRLASVSGTLLAIPFLLESAIIAHAVRPGFLLMAVAKVASKVFDYSLFRAAKEILYIPLSDLEKRQGKAVVDILTYRVAKAGASLLLLALGVVHSLGVVPILLVGLGGVWLLIVVPLVLRYRRVTRSD